MSDLTEQEQAHVRAALQFLRVRCGGWEPLAKALHFSEGTLVNVGCKSTKPSASMALRIARLADVSIDDLLEGKFPPVGTCRHCGHSIDAG